MGSAEAPKVRTHSVYSMFADTLGGKQARVIVCRGCGKRWPYARTDAEALGRQPCGTPEAQT